MANNVQSGSARKTPVYPSEVEKLKTREASAPGKVLIAGGYLVLDEEHVGLVLALSARIHVRIVVQPGDDGMITVTSPQFRNATWKYKCYDKDGDLYVENLTPESSNNYVRLAISYVLAHFNNQTTYPNLSIEILADNDYYSQPSCSTYDERVKLPKFNKFNKPISEVNKTGLGSSAALITALTAALFSVMAGEDLSGSYNHTWVHNLAQAAHCAAQGKVGSGFDVAAAVYGSCIYRRFNPNYFKHIMLDADVYPKEFRKRLKNYIENEWKMETTPFELPAGLQIVMGDVTGGSETPSMVRSVLQWKDKSVETLKIWEELGGANQKFIDRFADIPITDKKEVVDAVIKRLDQDLPNTSYNPYLRQTLKAVAESFQDIRRLLRLMGHQASVPIEPPSQSALLDDSLKVKGVLLAGVPGAGGYDAIVCLIAADDGHHAFHQLQRAWEGREERVCPLLAQQAKEGLILTVEEEKA